MLGCYGLAATAFTVADEAIQSLAAIQNAASAFLMTQHRNRSEPPQIQLRDLDPRLRLAQCAAPLEAFLPGGAKTVGSTSIGVRCPGPKPWTVYQNATVQVFDQVQVASRFLSKGTVLSAADLRAERRELSGLPGGYETAAEQLIGKQLRQALMAGAEIAPQAVQAVPAIRRGETVTIISRQGGMEVSSSGIALSDAELGGRVRIRNESSQRVVEGTVTDKRQVEIGR
ncbi:MAG TPA: flagellar basal body P-ring formation chaperone FlgA [Candidatus Competibacteraceae bacterium]|nr:flagellar basal body P-ring formation protein FlgA [Candidatus Competibacter sp.]HRF45414.1 flagellar basal body P-ring formation chaperone FlgA [Candidatus Competibacteraceae bacterium]